jgi:hypothetical protein
MELLADTEATAGPDPERCRHRATRPGPDGDLCERCGATVASPTFEVLPGGRVESIADRQTARAYIAAIRRQLAARRPVEGRT